MLEDTGERIIPELMKATNGLLLEHIARYYFAIPYLKGRVLDIACGTGYGAMLLAKAGKNRIIKQGKERIDEIVGVDLDPETIAYARNNYYHPLVTYQVGDVTDSKLPDKLGQFDVIVSFETIEHVEHEELFLQNIYRMLKPGGTLILSSPFGQGRGIPSRSPFHVHQLTREEFKNLFPAYEKVSFYCQLGVLIEPPREEAEMDYRMGIAVCKK